jgi:hypothetical protein
MIRHNYRNADLAAELVYRRLTAHHDEMEYWDRIDYWLVGIWTGLLLSSLLALLVWAA